MCYWCASNDVRVKGLGATRGKLVDCPCCGRYEMAREALFIFFELPGDEAPSVFTTQQKMAIRVHILNENIAERIPTISLAVIKRITGLTSEGKRFAH